MYAIRVVGETDLDWQTECVAEGCAEVVTQPKREGRPVDPWVDGPFSESNVKWVDCELKPKMCVTCGFRRYTNAYRE